MICLNETVEGRLPIFSLALSNASVTSASVTFTGAASLPCAFSESIAICWSKSRRRRSSSELRSSVSLPNPSAFSCERNSASDLKRPSTVSFKQIIVAPKANAASRAAAVAKADSLLVQIQKGGDFETIAKKESMDPGSKDQGGALPFARRGKMVEAFDRVLFSGLPPGTVVPIVIESPFGFHIIRIDRVRPAEVKASHILIIPKLDSADVARARLTADTVIRKWRTGTPYDTLVKYYHDPVEERSEPDGFLVDSLPPEYRAALADVKKGQLSQPFPIPNPQTGFPKFVIVLVTDRMDGGDFTMADVRDKIRQQLVQEREFRRMMDQVRREAFVKIAM